MQVPFNAPIRIYEQQEKEILASIQRVLKSGHYILGPEVKAFESSLAKNLKINSHKVISCNSCTDALILGLKVLGVQAGDEVITVSHTAIPTIVAIRSLQAIPVFCDIDENTWLMDLQKAKQLITKKTKAIIPVHLYGNMVPIGTDNFFGVPVLEDVAQAMGSTAKNQAAGTIGRVGAFSFYPTKNIGAIGDGGAISCKNDSDAEKLLMLRNYGQKDRYNAIEGGGMNSRLDEIQAAILSIRMNKLEEWNQDKSNTMQFYREELKNCPIRFQKIAENCLPVWHLAVIATENNATRDELKNFLEQEGVQTLIHYPIPTHLQKAFAEFSNKKLENTESLAKIILSLPLYPGLTQEEKKHTVATIKKFFGK